MPPRPFQIPLRSAGMPRKMRVWYLLIATIVSVVVVNVPRCSVGDLQGRPTWLVKTVHDGDTVTCIDTASTLQKIRLVGIDAPEFLQAYGEASQQVLEGKVLGRRVRVEGTSRDQYGRLLGTLWINDRMINREMVAEGYAWVFGGYAPAQDLLDAESLARQGRRGLWADPRPIAPQKWRNQHPRR